MKQPIWALPTAGGAAALGLAAALVSAYRVADCIRYQITAGQCIPTLEAEALPFLSGLGAAIGPVSGFMIYNRKLERPGDEPMVLPELSYVPPYEPLAPELPAGWWVDERGRFRDDRGRIASDDRRERTLEQGRWG
jgi:hypothetical protein